MLFALWMLEPVDFLFQLANMFVGFPKALRHWGLGCRAQLPRQPCCLRPAVHSAPFRKAEGDQRF